MRISDWRSDVCSSDLLEGYVENVYVSTRDARDALIDMYDICIETNPYSDAAKQILILAAFINIYNKSRMNPAHILRCISLWPECFKAIRYFIYEPYRSSSSLYLLLFSPLLFFHILCISSFCFFLFLYFFIFFFFFFFFFIFFFFFF